MSRRRLPVRVSARVPALFPVPRDPQSALEGSLAEVQLATVLAILEMERRSGVIALGSEAQGGQVMVRAGQAVSAAVFGGERLRGREALFAMLGWRGGRFLFRPGLVDVADELGASTTGLLLEAARRNDEGAAAASAL